MRDTFARKLQVTSSQNKNDDLQYSALWLVMQKQQAKDNTNTDRIIGFHQLPLSLTWINFNLSMDKLLHQLYGVDWNYLFISKLPQCSRWSLGMDK